MGDRIPFSKRERRKIGRTISCLLFDQARRGGFVAKGVDLGMVPLFPVLDFRRTVCRDTAVYDELRIPFPQIVPLNCFEALNCAVL